MAKKMRNRISENYGEAGIKKKTRKAKKRVGDDGRDARPTDTCPTDARATNSANSQDRLPAFISSQVSKSQYFFLDSQSKQVKDLMVVCGGMEICQPDYRVDRNRFSYFAIEFVAHGQGIFWDGEKEYSLQEGSVFGYTPDMTHAIISDSNQPLIKYFVDFTGEQAKTLFSEVKLEENKLIQLAQTHWICNIFDQMIETGNNSAQTSRAHCNLLLQTLVSRIDIDEQSDKQAESLAHETYMRCKNYIEKNFLKISTTAQWSKDCHLDQAYLSRLFKRFSDKKPYQFLVQLKMEHAAYLMLQRGALVKQAAHEVGFLDPEHFSRVFKRTHGVSPRGFFNATRQ